MNQNETLLGIQRVLRSVLGGAPVTLSRATEAMDIPGWDSLSHTLILMEIEASFDVRLPLDRVPQLGTVGDLVDLVFELKANTPVVGALPVPQPRRP